MENDLLKNIWIEQYSIQIYTVEKKTFTLYSFILVKTEKSAQYSWKINKLFSDFQNLNKELLKSSTETVLEFPSKQAFFKQSDIEQLEFLAKYLKSLIASSTFSLCFAEFLEVSIMSFTGTQKLKEGYVYKHGSGRVTNQKRCFNCCSKIFGMKKRWLRVLPNGIECRSSNVSKQVEEVINYSKGFKIKFGKKDTGLHEGVNIVTAQHNFLFKAENFQKRDEWVEAIVHNFNKNEYNLFHVRYNSSFIIRENNTGNWYIDGEKYFHDVFTHLLQAKSIVCICDWWLSPDMYLKRPVSLYPDSKIVDVLGSLADRGVQIYVLLYKEITFTLSLNSLYTKRALKARNPNIKILRHPTVGIRGGEFLWSHHSKLICIDNSIAFLGGLDMCYGRWDTQKHGLSDFEGDTWPGIDYSNVRVSDFVKVDKWQKDSVDRSAVPRMPWHDVCVSVSGPVVKDLWGHFMEVWNHIIKDITGKNDRKNMLQLPDNTINQRIQNGIEDVIIKNNEESKMSILIDYEYKGLVSNNKVENNEEDEVKEMKVRFRKTKRLTGTSFVETHPNAKFNFIDVMKKFIEKRILDPYPNAPRIQRSVDEPDLEMIRREEAIDEFETNQTLQDENSEHYFNNIAKRSSTEFFMDNNGNMEFQVLRSAGSWSLGREISEESIHSAYLQLIYNAKSFIYIENQFFISRSAGDPVANSISEALIKRIEIAVELEENFRVIVVLPLLPAFEGSVDDPGAAVLRVQLHWEYRTICRGKTSIYEMLKKVTPNPEKYISFYSLRTHAVINETPVTEMIYIHSKLMIVDDLTVVIGSANINDRSMNGDRDAEIAVVINDKEKITRIKNGLETSVSKFAYDFRINLFKEHSGCSDENTLQDPFSQEFYKVWDKRAKRNTRYYRKVFGCYPDDKIKNLAMVKDLMQKADLSKYEKYKNKIKGNIVQFPLDFLIQEDLKISVTQKEYLLPDVTFV